MQTTVSKLRTGSRLLLGKYTASNGAEPVSVCWLKANPECDFISEFVLDYICFDGKEGMNANDFESRQYGNSRYDSSNILSFANSGEEMWYQPMHEFDSPPRTANAYRRNNLTAYESHQGFLYYFADYEILSIKQTEYSVDDVVAYTVASLIRLPDTEEIIGDKKFPLFNKKGIRPSPTGDLIDYKRMPEFTYGSFMPFWCRSPGGAPEQKKIFVQTIDRTGSSTHTMPLDGCGFRPVCSMNPETVILRRAIRFLLNTYGAISFLYRF